MLEMIDIWIYNHINILARIALIITAAMLGLFLWIIVQILLGLRINGKRIWESKWPNARRQ